MPFLMAIALVVCERCHWDNAWSLVIGTDIEINAVQYFMEVQSTQKRLKLSVTLTVLMSQITIQMYISISPAHYFRIIKILLLHC